MRMERVEEVCLEVLRQMENPLTPVSLLYQKCSEEEGAGLALTEEGLLQFLRNHADIVVVEGVSDDAAVNTEEFVEAGIIMGPRAILKSRIPTPDEMRDMFRMQVEQMRDNLSQALKLARENKNETAVKAIETVLEHAESIAEKMSEV